MSNNITAPLTITYGAFTYDFATLPHASVLAMLQRGVAHYHGNEQSSKIATRIKKALVDRGDDAEAGKAARAEFEAFSGPEQRAAIEAFRKGNPDQIEAWTAEVQGEATKALHEGTVGVSVRGPAADPLQTILNRLGKASVINTLKAAKIAVPKKADEKIEFGDGKSFTMAELVARRLAHEKMGPDLLKQAKKVLADQQKAVDAAAGLGVEDL